MVAITFKTLSGKTHVVDMEPTDTFGDELKQKVGESMQLKEGESVTKLIYSGAMIAADQTLESIGFKEGGFIVVMSSKKKEAVPAPAPAPVPTHVVTPPAPPPVANQEHEPMNYFADPAPQGDTLFGQHNATQNAAQTLENLKKNPFFPHLQPIMQYIMEHIQKHVFSADNLYDLFKSHPLVGGFVESMPDKFKELAGSPALFGMFVGALVETQMQQMMGAMGGQVPPEVAEALGGGDGVPAGVPTPAPAGNGHPFNDPRLTAEDEPKVRQLIAICPAAPNKIIIDTYIEAGKDIETAAAFLHAML